MHDYACLFFISLADAKKKKTSVAADAKKSKDFCGG
jgi:hypothetical protein